MATLLKNSERPIINEFVKDIDKVKFQIPKDKDPIPFRNDMETKTVRNAYRVPIDLLKFRKDNGRIASDVLTYEFNKGELNETTDFGQLLLKEYLQRKDPPEGLYNLILKEGQRDYAVITADGFLINGNRRKMVFHKLLEKFPGDEKYKYLNVVILPGPSDSEALPTYLEIEQLENRYQYQNTGKAEYYNFDKALSIKRKLELGMTLDEQLRDDAQYAHMSPSDFEKAKSKFNDDFLKPLECIDTYLSYLGRPGHYNTVSEGKGDSEGRWQAFLDYYNMVYKQLANDKKRFSLGILDDEQGKVENIAFKIIRKRDIEGLDKKVHQVMRDLPKLLKNESAKRELFKLVDIPFELSEEESTEDGKPVGEKTKDIIWSNKYSVEMNEGVRQAYRLWQDKKDQDSPIDLLNAALDKLTHTNMNNIVTIEDGRIDEAVNLSKSIQIRANEIESNLMTINKKKKKVKSK